VHIEPLARHVQIRRTTWLGLLVWVPRKPRFTTGALLMTIQRSWHMTQDEDDR
jgi:hypothetical protein